MFDENNLNEASEASAQDTLQNSGSVSTDNGTDCSQSYVRIEPEQPESSQSTYVQIQPDDCREQDHGYIPVQTECCPPQNPTQQIQYQTHVPVTPPPRPEKKKKNPWVIVSVICIAIAVICIGALTYVSVKANLDSQNPSEQSSNNGSQQSGTNNVDIKQSSTPNHESTTGTDDSGRTVYDTVDLVEKMLPSIVYVEVTTSTGAGSGSGVIMTNDGYIITNAHVIENARTIKVKTNDGQEYTATSIGYDSSTDVGVIKIMGTFTAAEFGDSDNVSVGETVVAIGSPFGANLFQTVTKGIVSGVRDDFKFSDLGLTVDVIQHDAAINSGNSGGALVNEYGQVIGINSYKISGEYENLGFALQINGVIEIAKDLISYGKVEKPFLGVTVQTETTVGGAKVTGITSGGAAEAAGLMTGDIITKADDTDITAYGDLSRFISSCSIGQTITLTILRNGEQTTIKVTLRSSLDS